MKKWIRVYQASHSRYEVIEAILLWAGILALIVVGLLVLI